MTNDINKKEKTKLDLLLIENIEKNLFASKNEIQQLKKNLNHYNDERIEMKNQIEKIITVIKPQTQEKDTSNISSTNIEKRLQFEESLNIISLQMNQFSANERKLKQELKKQKSSIEHLSHLKNGYLHEIEENKLTIHLYERSTKHLSTALDNSKQLIRDTVKETEEKIQDTVESVENKQLELLNKIEKQEQTLLKYKQLKSILGQKLEEKNNNIYSLKQEVNELNKQIEKREHRISKLEKEVQQKSQNLIEITDQKPKQKQDEMYTIKKGSWLNMAWQFWSNDNETQYFEKTEQLNRTIKDLQQGLKYYEGLLEKMNDHFQRYEEDQMKNVNHVKELNDEILTYKENEQKYVRRIESLEKELMEFKEQEQTFNQQKEDLNKTINEIKQREEEYKSQLEKMKLNSIEQTQQLKETIRGFQEKEKQYREQFQHTPNYAQRKLEKKSLTTETKSNNRNIINHQTKQSSLQQQQNQSRHEKLKQYYPQAQSQRSIINPFK
jgi:chromosome segregation ATPase